MSKERELMEVLNKENSNFRFYKKKDNDKIWSVEEIGYIGKLLYSFNKKIYIIYGQIIHIILQKKRKSYLIKKIHTGKNSFQAEIKEP